MFGLPPTTVREALASLAYRVALSAVVLWLAVGAWYAPAPGIPLESNYWLVLVGVVLACWCASALASCMRIAWRGAAAERDS